MSFSVVILLYSMALHIERTLNSIFNQIIQIIFAGIWITPRLIDLTVIAILFDPVLDRVFVNWLRSIRQWEFGSLA